VPSGRDAIPARMIHEEKFKYFLPAPGITEGARRVYEPGYTIASPTDVSNGAVTSSYF